MKRVKSKMMRVGGIVLTIAMMISMCGMPAVTAKADASATQSCNHVCNEACGGLGAVSGGAATVCTHVHDEECGYEKAEAECTCGTDDPAFHATNCPAYIAPENPQCICVEKCTDDTLNVWCDVCGVQGVNACQGTDTATTYAETPNFSDAKDFTEVNGVLCIDGVALTINTTQSGNTYVIIPEGKYKLTGDIATDAYICTEGSINLDLNGYTWDMSDKNLSIDDDVTLSLYDTSVNKTGKITTSSHLCTIYLIGSGSTFNLYSGTVVNTSDSVGARGVSSVFGSSNLYGGTIKSNAYAVFYYLREDITINIDKTSFDCGDGYAQISTVLNSNGEPCAVIDVSDYEGGALTVDAMTYKAGKIKIFTGIQSAQDAENYKVNVSCDDDNDFFKEKEEYEENGGNKYVYVSVPSFTTQPTKGNDYTVAFNHPDATLQWCEATVYDSATYSKENGNLSEWYEVNDGDTLIASISECSDDFRVDFDCSYNEESLYMSLDSSRKTASVTFDSEGTVEVYFMLSPYGTGEYKMEHVRCTKIEGEIDVQLSKTECETTYVCKATVGETVYYSDIVTIEEEHSYTCTATSDNVITKECANCGKSGTLTITAEGGIYDGTTAYGATVIKTGILENEEVIVNYYQGDTLIGTDAPVNAGTYTAKITYEGVTASYQFTIEKADSVITAAPTPIADLEYNGTAQNLINAGTATGGEMQYSLDGTNYSSAIPTGTDAKTYTVWYKVVGDKNHNDTTPASIEVTIAPKSVEIEGVSCSNRKYVAGDATVEVSDIQLSGVATGDDVSVNLTGVKGTLSSDNAGTYTSLTLPALTLTGADKGNYELVQPTGPVTVWVGIEKLNAEISVEYPSYGKIFGDSPFSLGVSDNNPEAEVTYKSDNEDVATVTSEGIVTIHKVGLTQITVSLAESTNYISADSKQIDVVVAKKDGYTVDTIQRNYLYSRENADTIDLSAYLPADCGEVTYGTPAVREGQIFSVAPTMNGSVLGYSVAVGEVSDAAQITVTVKSDNYADFTITVVPVLVDQLPVSPKTEVTLTNDTITYGDALSEMSFEEVVFEDEAGNAVAGTLAWKEPSATPNAGTTSATWVFTPNNAAYASVEGTVAITVNKATPNVTGVPTVADRVYNPSVVLADSDLTGGTVKGVDGNSLEGSWSWKVSGTVPVVNNSGYEAVFTPVDANYETVTGTIMVTVTKATPYVATKPTASALTYGQTLNQSVLSNGVIHYSETDSTVVAGSFAWEAGTVKPAVADSNATSYIVVFTPADNTNYNKVEIQITLTVNKAENAPNMPSATMDVSYDTKTVGAVTLPTGWAWEAADVTKTLTTGESVTAIALYKGADAGNYETETVEVVITRSACSHSGDTELKNASAASCTVDGYTGDTYCKDCGERISVGQNISAPGHDYNSQVTTGPTTSSEGVRTYTCENCGDSYTESIPKLPAPTSTPTVVPTPTAAPSPSPVPTATPSPSPVPTATPSPSPVPTATPSPAPTATPSPSPTQVPTVITIVDDESGFPVEVQLTDTEVILSDVAIPVLNKVLDGDAKSSDTISIELSTLENEIDSVTMHFTVIEWITDTLSNPDNGTDQFAIVMQDGATLAFDAEAFSQIAEQAAGQDVSFKIEQAEAGDLSKQQQDAVDGRPAYDLSTFSAEGVISEFGGTVTVTVPYELQEGEKAEGIQVYYVDGNGKKEACETHYDSEKQTVSWTTTHFSVYLIAYEEPATEAEKPAYVSYTVQKGDTLRAIANQFGCTVADILAANRELIKDADLILIGWTLNIPQATEADENDKPDVILPEEKKTTVYVVKKGDTLWMISQQYGCTVKDIMELNREQIKDADMIYIGWELTVPQK